MRNGRWQSRQENSVGVQTRRRLWEHGVSVAWCRGERDPEDFLRAMRAPAFIVFWAICNLRLDGLLLHLDEVGLFCAKRGGLGLRNSPLYCAKYGWNTALVWGPQCTFGPVSPARSPYSPTMKRPFVHHSLDHQTKRTKRRNARRKIGPEPRKFGEIMSGFWTNPK